MTLVNRLIIVLSKLCLSQNSYFRKRGLVGLAAVMLGFKNGYHLDGPPPGMVEEVVRPILSCLVGPDPRIRFHPSDSMLSHRLDQVQKYTNICHRC